MAWVQNREGRWELWTPADFDRFWEEATEGLAEHLDRTREDINRSFARSFRQLEQLAQAEAEAD